MRNTRFTVALHILTAANVFNTMSEDIATSDDLAWSINTNPVVVRRIVQQLTRGGLVTSQTGPKGGIQLARAAEEITLRDVYRVIENEHLFSLHASEPNPECTVGGHIQPVLTAVFDAASEGMQRVLDQYTIADLTREVLARGNPE